MMNQKLECICDLCKVGFGALQFIGHEPFFVCKSCSILLRREWARRTNKNTAAA